MMNAPNYSLNPQTGDNGGLTVQEEILTLIFTQLLDLSVRGK